MIVIAIDPGQSGGVAVMSKSENQPQILEDLPLAHDGKLTWVDTNRLRGMLAIIPSAAVFVIERVHSSPQMGVASSFKFGINFGSILGLAGAMQLPVHLVTPHKWKAAMGLKKQPDEELSKFKARSRSKACQLYPSSAPLLSLAKHEGRAEALLLAHYFLFGGIP